MSQQTLDFFVKKKPIPAPAEPKINKTAPTEQVNEPKKPRIEKTTLKDFTRGNAPDPNYLENPKNRARHEAALKNFGPKPKTVAPKRAYKPLELQFIELKREYMDTILFVEVGFRYRAWGQDAATVARIFGFKESNGWLSIDESVETDVLYDRFATFSFPTQRLAFYVQKLVNAGHKVGVVNQSETSALKKAGSAKSGPFKRQVSAIYTKGTFIDDFDSKAKDGTVATGSIFALYEPSPYKFAICSVQPSTGEIIYDSFTDSAIVTELETRVLHMEPCEIVKVGEVSPSVKKLIESLQAKASVRLESVEAGTVEDIDSIKELDDNVQVVASCLVRYLRFFKLDDVFSLKQNYSPFNVSSCMYLNGNTLTALEIFNNSTDFKTEGSLFWVMDNTKTKFGQRLLRKWIAQPLLEREMLEERIDAVRELIKTFCTPTKTLLDRMKGVSDLERYILQIHYGRITRKQLYECLRQFNRICGSYTIPQIKSEKFKNRMLLDLLYVIPSGSEFLESCLRRIDPDGVKDGDITRFFYDQHSGSIAECKEKIESIQQRFEAYIKTIKLGFDVKYVSVLVDEYLIEVKSTDAKKVPEEWQKMSATKAFCRFRTPETFALIKELDLAKEELDLACEKEFISFLNEIKQSYDLLRRILLAIAQVDCLMSLAALSSKPGYSKADYVDEHCIDIEAGRHPVIDELITENYIPNDCKMYANHSKAMVVTGPNMGGKSSYVRQCALILIMAQVGSYVPARKARICMVDAIYTRMGAYDNMSAGESTFQVELKECANILSHATSKSLVILDEIGRGTSTTDGVAIAYSVLDYMVEKIGSFTLFITHYPLITELASVYPNVVTNWCMEFSEDSETKLVTFLYRLVSGVAHRSYGLNVARLADLPSSIIDLARVKSEELEKQTNTRRTQNALITTVKNVLSDESVNSIRAAMVQMHK